MSNNIKISIIIPVFNAEGTIKESIKSASNQTISDLEIICIDNNSTDNSVLLIKKLQERDNRIILFHEDSQGAGPARNRGIHESTGEFIFFLDPDDAIFSENTLERLYNLAKKYKKNIVGGSVFIHDPIKKEEQIGDKKYYFETDGIIKYEDYQFDWGFWRFIYKRKFLEDNSIQFPPYLRGQDTVFFVKAMVLAKDFYAIQDYVYLYNFVFSTKKYSTRAYLDYEKANLEVIEIAKKNQLKELEASAVSHRIPLVSIIIPVYNTKREDLVRCLESVATQTYHNLEVIVVDDGSNSETAIFLDGFAKKYHWAVYHQKNKGLSAARNRGFKCANGKYIQFLDSDDYFDPNLITASLSLALKMDADIVIENFKSYNANSDQCTTVIDPDILPVDSVFQLTDLNNKKIGRVPFTVWSKFFKKEFLDKNEIFHDEKLFRAEDVLFSYTAMVLAERMVFLPDTYIVYREDAEGSNSVTNDKYPVESVKAWEKLHQLLKKYNLYEIYREDFEYAMVESVYWHLIRLHTNKGVQKLSRMALRFMKDVDISIENDYTSVLLSASTNPNILRLIKAQEARIKELSLDGERKNAELEKKGLELESMSRELNSHLGIKRSLRLVAGNVKRYMHRLIK